MSSAQLPLGAGPRAQPAWKREILERKRAKLAGAAGGEPEPPGGERLVVAESLGPLRENPFIRLEGERRRLRQGLPGHGPGAARPLQQLLELYSAVPGIRTIRADHILIIESKHDVAACFAERDALLGRRRDPAAGSSPPRRPDPLRELLARRGAALAEIRADQVVIYEAAEPPEVAEPGTVSRILEKFGQRPRGRRRRGGKALTGPGPGAVTSGAAAPPQVGPGSPRAGPAAPPAAPGSPRAGPPPPQVAPGSPRASAPLRRRPGSPRASAPKARPGSPRAVPAAPQPPPSPPRAAVPSAVPATPQPAVLLPTPPRDVTPQPLPAPPQAIIPQLTAPQAASAPPRAVTPQLLPAPPPAVTPMPTAPQPLLDAPQAVTLQLTAPQAAPAPPQAVTTQPMAPQPLPTPPRAVTPQPLPASPQAPLPASPRAVTPQPLPAPPRAVTPQPLPASPRAVTPQPLPASPRAVPAIPKATVPQANCFLHKIGSNSFTVTPRGLPPGSRIPEPGAVPAGRPTLPTGPPVPSASPSHARANARRPKPEEAEADVPPLPSASLAPSATSSTQPLSAFAPRAGGSFEILPAPKPDLAAIPAHDLQAQALAKLRLNSRNSFLFVPRREGGPALPPAPSAKPGLPPPSLEEKAPKEPPKAPAPVQEEPVVSPPAPPDPSVPVTYIDDIVEPDSGELSPRAGSAARTGSVADQPGGAGTELEMEFSSVPVYRPHSAPHQKGGSTFTVVPKRKPVASGLQTVTDASRKPKREEQEEEEESKGKGKAVENADGPQAGVSHKKRYPTVNEIEVIGGYLSLERSCMSKTGSRRKKMKISFNETSLQTMFEYPSESSLAEEEEEEGHAPETEEDKSRTFHIPRPNSTLQPSTANSADLSSYTPKHSVKFSTWQEQKYEETPATEGPLLKEADSHGNQVMLTPAEKAGLSGFSSEPALYF
ncbi:taperin [Tyto alba]|uniref:taperin n=1 Tax=Tyto alba TaxID=56313 RepID=UPI001C677E2B|nr:taperin [Tyto alba]